VTEIHITASEQDAGVLSGKSVALAADAIRADGYAILHGAMDVDVVGKIGRRMLEEVQAILDLPEPPHNFAWGNVQHDPPTDVDFLFPAVLCNPYVAAVTRAVLGEGAHNGFYSGNTNLPRSRVQPVHVDTGHLWRGLEQAHPACQLVVNFAPFGMDEANGATEVWPGSHLDTTVSRHDASICVPLDVLEARRQVRSPISAHLPPGSVLMRDIRLWHRGVPNPSDAPRLMVALIQSSAFLPAHTLDFPAGSEHVFEDADPRWHVRFADEPIDYIGRNSAYDYDDSGPA
jgi:hypothetical protein